MLKDIVFVCDCCKSVGHGKYFTGGFWSYPANWFVSETEKESVLVCSDCIVEALLELEQQMYVMQKMTEAMTALTEKIEKL